jgi:hypothetical protein
MAPCSGKSPVKLVAWLIDVLMRTCQASTTRCVTPWWAARSQTQRLAPIPLAAAEPMQMGSREIVPLVLSFNLGGDGFRNALDPRHC